MTEAVKKVVLAYSGGLDTSVILRWLQETYRCEVVTFTADLGQGEELGPARRKAELLGAREIFVDDLRDEFVRDFVFPMFRANALYEGAYLLGTSIARPLIAKRQIEIARQVGADAVAHGATGKGNDQVRFELSYYALDPDIKVIAPWREWDLTSRTRLLDYAEQHQIPIAKDRRGEAPFSVDANLLHISAEGKVLEDPWIEPEEFVYSRTVAPEAAPDVPQYIEIAFERGDPVAVDGEALSPAALLTRLNEIGGRHGAGRLDLVENRFVGMKSRGVYETPGGTILQAAHRGIESLTLDRGASHLKDDLMPRYAELIYNGFWFSPEREMLQALIDKSQEHVEGVVRLKLYKGSVRVVGRRSAQSLYSLGHVTFEEDAVYDQRDAEGFIRLNALRLRLAALRFEPIHHDPVECFGMLDIGEVPGVGDFLVATAGDQPGEAPVLARRRARIVGAAYHQGRHAKCGKLSGEVEPHDRRRAAEISGWCRRCNGVADLLPPSGLSRPERLGEPALHRAVGERLERVCTAHRAHPLVPQCGRTGRARRQRVAPQGRNQLGAVVDRERLADHTADREANIVHSGEGKHLEHRGNVPRERLHRVVAGDRIAAAMAAHVDAQYAKPGLQQRGHLLGPHPAIGCQ